MKALSLWQPWADAIFRDDEEGVPLKPDETISCCHRPNEGGPMSRGVNGADILRRLRLSLVKGTPGWRVICRATDYIDRREGRTTYYKTETPWYRRWRLR